MARGVQSAKKAGGGRGRKAAPDELAGKRVLAPRSLWPDYPLPRGQTGWEGTVGKRKDGEHHFVSFPGDAGKYFFADSEIRKWVLPEQAAAAGEASGDETEAEDEAPKRPAASPRKPAPSASSGGRRPAGSKREREEAAPAAPPSSSKKQPRLNRAAKIALIDAHLEEFNDAHVTEVYECVLRLRLQK